MNKERFLKRLEAHIDKNHGNQTSAAKAYGISDAYMSYIVSGSRPPNKGILDDMELEKITRVTYIKRINNEI